MSRADWAILAAVLAVAIAFGWWIRESAVQDCAELVHSDPALCRQLGGVMESDADRTVCVFTCTVPP